MRKTAHFLTGDAYAFDLPDAYDPEVELRSTVRLDGARHIVYRPHSHWRPPPDDDPQLRHVFDVRGAFTTVKVYKAVEEPPRTLMAFWRLPDGLLSTFMQDDTECGVDVEGRLKTVIRDLDVRLSRYGLPLVRFGGDLRGPDPTEWVQRDRIVFTPRDRAADWPHLTIRREPAWVMEGRNHRDDGDVAAVESLTTAQHVTLEAFGPPARRAHMREELAQIASSMVPVR